MCCGERTRKRSIASSGESWSNPTIAGWPLSRSVDLGRGSGRPHGARGDGLGDCAVPPRLHQRGNQGSSGSADFRVTPNARSPRVRACKTSAHLLPRRPGGPFHVQGVADVFVRPPPRRRRLADACGIIGPACDLRIFMQTESGQLVSEKSAVDGPRLANRTNKPGRRRTAAVLSGVPERQDLAVFLRDRFAKSRDSARFAVRKRRLHRGSCHNLGPVDLYQRRGRPGGHVDR